MPDILGGPGSVLIFPHYWSDVIPYPENAGINDTKITIYNACSNLADALDMYVHLFFIAEDGEIESSFQPIAMNQALSLWMSQIDPNKQGYIVAVACNAAGEAIKYNYLIGEAQYKKNAGEWNFFGSYQALTIPAIAAPAAPGGGTQALAFDGVKYGLLPRKIAIQFPFGPMLNGGGAFLAAGKLLTCSLAGPMTAMAGINVMTQRKI
jgi:hypothetical protein